MAASAFRTGRTGTYTIAIDNVGTASAGPIVVADTLPNGVSFRGASGSGWRCVALLRIVLCARAGGLSAGQSTSLVLNVNVSARAGTVVSNTATAVAAQEPNTSNNTATVTTSVTR